jgi:hypothetical protein
MIVHLRPISEILGEEASRFQKKVLAGHEHPAALAGRERGRPWIATRTANALTGLPARTTGTNRSPLGEPGGSGEEGCRRRATILSIPGDAK